MPVGLEHDAFFFQQDALPFPSGSRAPHGVDDAVARQHGSLRSIAKRAPHHPGVAWPACQSGDEAVSHHAARGNLADDAEHIGLERPRLLRRHFVETIPHDANVSWAWGLAKLRTSRGRAWRDSRGRPRRRCRNSPSLRDMAGASRRF